MPEFSAENLALWSRGEWTADPEQPLYSVSHDTRELQPGALYVALPGARVDGHDLISEAKVAGAVAALCRKGRADSGMPCLEVADTGKALENIAKGYRSTLQTKQMIGVTGSAGKTTVKDFMAAMLGEAAPTRSTRGNWNNFIGLPLSLLAMEATDVFGVFEVGMNQAGEIAGLADILKPQYGLITSIGEAHLEKLGSVEAIAKEKSSLLSALPAEGMAVLDADSEWFAFMKKCCVCRTVTVSLHTEADYQAEGTVDQLTVFDRQRNETFTLPLPMPGTHMQTNLLQAVAMVRECGLSVQEITDGLKTYSPAPMRWQPVVLNAWRIINDAYNANPLSMRESIRTFANIPHSGERWLVLGGMNELGDAEKELHVVLGKEVDRYPFDGVVLVGEKGAWMRPGISKTPVFEAADHAETVRVIQARIPRGAALLLKASRSERLETILKTLAKAEEPSV